MCETSNKGNSLAELKGPRSQTVTSLTAGGTFGRLLGHLLDNLLLLNFLLHDRRATDVNVAHPILAPRVLNVGNPS